MKNLFTLIFLIASAVAQAATYRTYIGHTLSGNTYTIYVNSDTAFGEESAAQICYTPSGGGGTAFTGFQIGTFNTSYSGANWTINVTVPAGATNLLLELATDNQSNQLYGYTGCNISLSTVLPVELVKFQSEKLASSIVLHWTTASERNSDKFEIEHSADGNTFKTIGEVKSVGTSYTIQEYTFEDKLPQTGLNYYRLRQVDFNGSSDLSDILTVDFNKGKRSFSVYPNPIVGDEVFIDFPQMEKSALIRLFNLQGKLLREWTIDTEGATQLALNLSGLSENAMFLQINERDCVVLIR